MTETEEATYADDFEPISESTSVSKKPSARASVAHSRNGTVRASRASRTVKHATFEAEAPISEEPAPRVSKAARVSKVAESKRTSKISKSVTTKPIKETITPVQEEGEQVPRAAEQPKAGKSIKKERKVTRIAEDTIDNENTPKSIHRRATEAVIKKTEEDPEDKAWNWKHYHTLYPVANKLLAKKWDDISREKHLKKLANIKKSVDDRPPPKYIHLKANLKRVQMEQERQVAIRRNNRILIEKMSDITKHEHLVEGQEEHDARVELFARGNEHHRKQKNDRIHQENLAILQRLEGSKSDYDHEKIKMESGMRLHHLKTISTFPQKYIKMIKQQVERDMQKDSGQGNNAACCDDEHEHDRHHWHGPYGGKPIPHALERAAFPGEEVVAFSKKTKSDKVGVADVDKTASTRKKEKSTVPPIVERDGPLARETSPVAAV
ncbi:hypothetical protein HDU99_003524 [Rhizoclosmatium hyalinum]|nr:hypothetical protein HDU99_003524 [Rhizoclosmatium hyalinum]